jgi:hypothetical protein
MRIAHSEPKTLKLNAIETENLRSFLIGIAKTSSVTIEIVKTGIGTTVVVKSSDGDEANVTDFDCW